MPVFEEKLTSEIYLAFSIFVVENGKIWHFAQTHGKFVEELLQMGGEDEKESALTFAVKKGWNWNKCH